MPLRFKDEAEMAKYGVKAVPGKGAGATTPAPPELGPEPEYKSSPFINGVMLMVLGWLIGFCCGMMFQ